jgi:hypothetical protein
MKALTVIIKETENDEILTAIGNYFMIGGGSPLSYDHDSKDEEILSAYPEEIQNIFHLSSFNAVAGGGGLIGFVMQQPGYLIRGAHKALDTIGYRKLNEFYEQAIAVSVLPDDEGEMWCDYTEYEADLSWYKNFKTDLTAEAAEEELDVEEVFDLLEEINTVAIPYIEQYVKQLDNQ